MGLVHFSVPFLLSVFACVLLGLVLLMFCLLYCCGSDFGSSLSFAFVFVSPPPFSGSIFVPILALIFVLSGFEPTVP